MRNIAIAAAVAMFAAQPIHAGEVMYRMCIKGLQNDVFGSRHVHTCANARVLQTATRLQFLSEPPTEGYGLVNKEKYNERFS